MGLWQGFPSLQGLKCSTPLQQRPQASAEGGGGKGLARWDKRGKPSLLCAACGDCGHPCHCPDAGRGHRPTAFSKERKGYMVVAAARCGAGVLARGAQGHRALLGETGLCGR